MPHANAARIKVAFVGDQGVGSNARTVLSLIANEATDLLLIQGDLGYDKNTAAAWNANLEEAFGPDFPILTLVGNHENHEWPLYRRFIQQRIDRAGGLSCTGEPGVKAACRYGNIEIVQVAPGITEVEGVRPDDDYAGFIRSSFAGAADSWRICSWHKNQEDLQTGSKGDATGWDVYEACLDAGAMVALAHEHAYSRTHLLSDFENQTVVHRDSALTLEPGRSFAFVSGLGGREVRPQQRGGDWWASIYTASQGATHGALFCTFEDATADCYFKAIDGSVPDRFSLQRATGNGATRPRFTALPVQTTGAATSSAVGYVFSRTDKQEYRWIDRDASGGMGNIWIDRACAERLGGPTVSGDWKALNSLSPAFDAVTSPCDAAPVTSPATRTVVGEGYVFSRTDKVEYRWIARDASGGMGNIWIDEACAERLGGLAESGDWKDLNTLAPGFDALASPCR